jgi:glucans biosynthesis protein C
MANETIARASTGRIHGLDTSRAVLLLLGVVIHAAFLSRWSGPVEYPEFDWFQLVIHSFRMEAFFAVAGYLTAITFPRRPTYLRGRLRQLLVPAACTWLIVLPPGWWAQYGSPMWRPHDLSTLWFLITLSVSTCILIFAERTGLNARVQKIVETLPTFVSLIAFFVFVCIAAAITEKFRWEWKLDNSISAGVWRVLNYAPYLFLGFYAYHVDRVADLLKLKLVRYIGLIALLFLSVHVAIDPNFYAASRPILYRVFSSVEISFVGLSMTLAILAWSGRLTTQSYVFSRISAGAFTIYLFHWSVLEVIYKVSPAFDPWLQFILYAPLTAVICFGIHQIISRSALLAFMFNGRPWPRGWPTHRPQQVTAR